jgi:hypothetical protein
MQDENPRQRRNVRKNQVLYPTLYVFSTLVELVALKLAEAGF